MTLSRSSSQNNYHCMNLEILVVSEENRREIYQKLISHQDIILVL
jgi:putative lipoic acid-binding regulatory protein